MVFLAGALAGLVVGILIGIGCHGVANNSRRSSSGCPHLNGQNTYGEEYFMNPVVRELDGQEKNKNLP